MPITIDNDHGRFPLNLVRDSCPAALPDVAWLDAATRVVTAAFGVRAPVGVVHGPVVDVLTLRIDGGNWRSQYRLQADEVARQLDVDSVLVLPGDRSELIDVCVPHSIWVHIGLRELLASPEFADAAAALPVALGRCADGSPCVFDLAAMPNLLVGEAPGSGKAKVLRAIVASLVYRFGPTELSLLIYDGPRGELSGFTERLAFPAVGSCDPRDAVAALRWARLEAERRFEKLRVAGVRNIGAYNRQHADRLPRVVVVVSEMDEVMNVARHEFEETLGELATMSRVVGIHVVLGTDDLSAHGLGGLTKAWVPSRVALRCNSAADSRALLDMPEADRLFGHGDLLFLRPGRTAPVLVHGARVSSSEAWDIGGHLGESRTAKPP